MYTIIKEYCPSAKRAVIRTNDYDGRLGKINLLVDEARRDFPHLSDWDIEIVHFGGQRYKRTFGIEFPVYDVPESYQYISQLELTL